MVKFTIYTEDKNRREIEVIVTKYFTGFTIIPAVGFYKGAREQSVIIELILDRTTKVFEDVKNLCEEIKKYNDQESILLTRENALDVEFIQCLENFRMCGILLTLSKKSRMYY